MSWSLKFLSKHFFSIMNFFFSCSIDLFATAATQKEKEISDESEKKESDEFINIQLISLKINDSFSRSKKINSENLNIIAMKKKIIAKLEILNKNLMKQFLTKIKLSINKRKTTDSSNNSLNLSFTMMFCEKRQMTHTKEQRKFKTSKNSTTRRKPFAYKRRKVNDNFDSKNY